VAEVRDEGEAEGVRVLAASRVQQIRCGQEESHQSEVEQHHSTNRNHLHNPTANKQQHYEHSFWKFHGEFSKPPLTSLSLSIHTLSFTPCSVTFACRESKSAASKGSTRTKVDWVAAESIRKPVRPTEDKMSRSEPTFSSQVASTSA
jgi:hypothetical protein